ncbi:MAG: hypothetical protein JW963_06605 [Anaerolineales bacterium]|nr:hypothetical protein [Anaerolineales bacterium]
MDNKTHTRQTGRARGNLLRLEQNLNQAKRKFKGETRNRMIGGVLLLIGLLALIGFLVNGNQFFAFIAAAGLFIGGLVFVSALVKRGGARRSMNTITDRVTSAQATLTELEGQPPTAE